MPPSDPLARAYLRDFERFRNRLITRMGRDTARYLRKLGAEAGRQIVAGVDPDDAINAFDERLLIGLRRDYEQLVVGTAARLQRHYGFVAQPDLQPILDAAGERIVTIQGTAREVVRAQVRVAIRAGLSNAQTERLIRQAVAHTYRAERIARTEAAFASNDAAAQVYKGEGITSVEVSDGPDCGWTSHDDPDKADGEIVPVDSARAQLISHPNCVRAFAPVV